MPFVFSGTVAAVELGKTAKHKKYYLLKYTVFMTWSHI